MRKTVFTQETLASWARHLGQMLEAGVPIVLALESLADQAGSYHSRRIQLVLSGLVSKGESLSDALSHYPKVFDSFFISNVKAGEVSGRLGRVLIQLADYLDHAQAVSKKIKAACLYPAIVASFSFIIILFLFVFIVPRMEQVITQSGEGMSLPLLTRFVIGVSNSFDVYFLSLIGVGVGVYFFIWRFVWRKNNYRTKLEKALIKIPRLGCLFQLWSAARFSSMLELLLKSGLPLLQSLMLTRQAMKGVYIQKSLEIVQYQVLSGISFSEAMQWQKVFPQPFIQMMFVGEKSGQLPDMLGTISKQYSDEINRSLEKLVTWIEPVLVVFLAIFIGVIVLAFFMPLVGLLDALGGF